MTSLPEYTLFLQACEALTAAQRAQVEELLQLHSVASEYIEYSGHNAQIPFSDRFDILMFKGLDLITGSRVDTAKLDATLAMARETQWHATLSPANILSPGGRETVCLRLPSTALDCAWQWEVQCEDGSSFSQEFTPQHLPSSGEGELVGIAQSARELALAPFLNGVLPIGYHRLLLRCLDEAVCKSHRLEGLEADLIVAPARAFEPDWALSGQRLWGFSVQLYSLRSQRNWGIGDFTDLSALIDCASGKNASFLVLNPLHVLDANAPQHCSPYSPNDRRRLNTLYIDPEREVEFLASPRLREMVADPKWQDRLAQLRSGDSIDYVAVAECKREIFVQMFRYFVAEHLDKNTARARMFSAFVEAQGLSLKEFAHFEAERLRSSDGFGTEADPRFTMYLQWLAESQFEACQQLARHKGMRIGLVRDLAVGGDGGGAEVNLNKDLYCALASIGAPPDPLAPQGQNWGLPPVDPNALRASGYRHFIELLRSNMAHCGALRIDHVMALMRLWWCPRYPGRGVGAYVHYNVDELFAILRLESLRSRCVVIGEDLGVVPPEVRTYINSSAIFSNSLFYFEKYDGFHFKKPEHYNPKSLAMVANHDVPTLAAWWNGTDLRLRRELELIKTEDDLHQQLQARREEKNQVLHWLGEQWLLPAQWQGDSESKAFDRILCAAIFRCCARSAAQMVSVQLEDLALLETPINIPGTSSEYPNWRRRLPADVSALIDSEFGSKLLYGFNEERNLQ
tara:strand:+ start:55420 stop:57642 length:2223 start_codon:yes stop_codon:yes gene_type:complete